MMCNSYVTCFPKPERSAQHRFSFPRTVSGLHQFLSPYINVDILVTSPVFTFWTLSNKVLAPSLLVNSTCFRMTRDCSLPLAAHPDSWFLETLLYKGPGEAGIAGEEAALSTCRRTTLGSWKIQIDRIVKFCC